MPCSMAPFTLRSLALKEWEGERVSNRDRAREREREGGREGGRKVCHALDYNQYVFGRRRLVLLWKALSFNSTLKGRQEFHPKACRFSTLYR